MTRPKLALVPSVLQATLLLGMAPAQADWFLPPLPQPRSQHAMCYDSVRQRLVMCGGNQPIVETWEWDGISWLRRQPAVSPPALNAARLVFDSARGRAVLFGGSLQTAAVSDATWEWDGTTWTQVATATRPAARRAQAMWYDSRLNRVFLFGGSTAAQAVADTWEYDGANWRTVATGVAPLARHSAAVAFDKSRGRAVLFGGSDNNGVRLGDTWIWDGTAWTAANPVPAPVARTGHSMAYDAGRARVVLVGGFQSFPPLLDTWEWDGAAWVYRADALPRFGSISGALEYCAHLGRCVYFGGDAMVFALSAATSSWNGTQWRTESPAAPLGITGSALAYSPHDGAVLKVGGLLTLSGPIDETWIWDGARWREPALTTRPLARSHASLYADPRRARVVLFGGRGQAGTLADTWEWDGQAWTQAFPAVSPSARSGAAIAYDPTRGRIVLFGGSTTYPGQGQPLGDQWEWDGVTWTQRSSNQAPSPRSGARMDFDSARSRLVLFGGATASGASSELWEWAGSDWTLVSSGPGPQARYSHGLCYDALRQRTMVAAGSGGLFGPFYDDAWQWDGAAWTQLVTATPLRSESVLELAFAADRATVVAFGINVRGLLEFRTAKPPLVARFGTACGAPPLVPSLSARPGSYPVPGARLLLTAALVRPAWPAFVALGASRERAHGLTLPYDLAAIGMPGCTLLQSCDVTLFALAGQGGVAEAGLGIPNDPQLLGARCYAQAFALDALANPLGWVASNALELGVGDSG